MEIRHWILTKLNVALVDKWFKIAGLHTLMNANCRKKDNFQNYSQMNTCSLPSSFFLKLALILALTCGWVDGELRICPWSNLPAVQRGRGISRLPKNYAPDERQSGGGQIRFKNYDLLCQKSRFTFFSYNRRLKVQNRLTHKIDR